MLLHEQAVSALVAMTIPIKAGGARLLLTADLAAGDSVTVSRVCDQSADGTSSPMRSTTGGFTDKEVDFATAFVPGESVVLTFKTSSASVANVLYTLTWSQ